MSWHFIYKCCTCDYIYFIIPLIFFISLYINNRFVQKNLILHKLYLFIMLASEDNEGVDVEWNACEYDGVD